MKPHHGLSEGTVTRITGVLRRFPRMRRPESVTNPKKVLTRWFKVPLVAPTSTGIMPT